MAVDADPGVGVGVAIGAAGAGSAPSANPLPRTHLSAHRFAQLFQINPLHFSGAVHGSFFTRFRACDKPWPRHNYQSSTQAGWEDLLLAIKDAEQTIEQWLNYNVAPAWTMEQEVKFPKYLNRYMTNAINFNGQRANVNVQRGHLIAGGQRKATVIHAGVTVTFSDQDGDGYPETATIVATIPGGVTVSDWRNVKVFFPGTSADPRWEIRPLKSVTLGVNTVTIVANSWQFIDPDLHAVWPGAGDDDYVPIILADVTPYVGTADVYLITNDPTATGSRFMWQQRPLLDCSTCAGVGCDECSYTTQDGCLVISNGGAGIVSPVPATYSSGWASQEFTIKRSPDKVLLWYYSGHVGQNYKEGLSSDPLDDWLAYAIAWLAIARLDREVCDCNNELFTRLQEDMAFVSPQGNFLAISEELQACPFGTKRGEVYAYRRIKLAEKFYTVATM